MCSPVHISPFAHWANGEKRTREYIVWGLQTMINYESGFERIHCLQDLFKIYIANCFDVSKLNSSYLALGLYHVLNDVWRSRKESLFIKRCTDAFMQSLRKAHLSLLASIISSNNACFAIYTDCLLVIPVCRTLFIFCVLCIS